MHNHQYAQQTEGTAVRVQDKLHSQNHVMSSSLPEEPTRQRTLQVHHYSVQH